MLSITKFNSFITVGAINNFEKNHYGNIIFENNLVKKEEKREKTFINSGIYIINPKVRDFLTKKIYTYIRSDRNNYKQKKFIFSIHEIGMIME